MARKCDICQKGTLRGHKVSHAKNRSKRTYKPNLQSATVVIDGVKKKLKACTTCLRTLKKKQG